MKKKQMAIISMILLTLTACASSPVETTAPPEAIKDAGTLEKDTGQDISNKKAAEDAQARELYETFINLEYSGYEGYSYVIDDIDSDGCAELYLLRPNQSFYTITYRNGGLRFEYQKELPPNLNKLQWINTATLTAVQDEEMTHSGIYYGAESWYLTEEDFVDANGFSDAEPFFEYYTPDGQKRLTFYYDEKTQKGCGVRYYERDPSTFSTTGMYGFVFEGLQEDTEEYVQRDYTKPESIDGTNGSSNADNFKENTEYDDKGRITHYDAFGALTFLKDSDSELDPILWIDYEYYDNGNLKSRLYWHNGYVFGTWYTTWDAYFDEQGRIAYEDIYITHGSWDTYYIYMDDTSKPAYILDLDNNMGSWIPEFRKVI